MMVNANLLIYITYESIHYNYVNNEDV